MIILDIIVSKLKLVEKDIEISPMSFAKNHMVVLLLVFTPLKKVESNIMSHKINETLDQRVHQVALASMPNGKYWIGIGQAEEGSGIIGHLIHLNHGQTVGWRNYPFDRIWMERWISCKLF